MSARWFSWTDEVWALGIVIQRRPQPLHGIVQALLEVNGMCRLATASFVILRA